MMIQYSTTVVESIQREQKQNAKPVTPPQRVWKHKSIPKIESLAPEFFLPAIVNREAKMVSLSEYRGKYIVLIFYTQDFSTVCATEIASYSERAQEFRMLNCELMACTTESSNVHMAWISTECKYGGLGQIDLILLADKSMKTAHDYGVLDEETGNCNRALFIIDVNGNIRQITINDPAIGRSVDDTIRLLQAIQFVDKSGYQCPANWRPGYKCIKPDEKDTGKFEYFKCAT